MKLQIAVLVGLLLVLTACTTQESPQVVEEVQNQIVEASEDIVLADTPVIEVEDVTVQVVDDVVEVTAEVDEAVEMVFAPFSEWCNAGQVYAYESEGVSYESSLVGVESYNDGQYCKGEQTQVMDVMGTQITIDTTYYISENQKEIIVIANAGGQVTESRVMLE